MCGGSRKRQIVSPAARLLVEILSKSETIVISQDHIAQLYVATATFRKKTRGENNLTEHDSMLF